MRLKITLFNTFEVRLDEGPPLNFATDRARALLAYLAIETERAQRRDTLATLLWPESPQKKARHNLRQAITHLRQALGESAAQRYLNITRESVQFIPASGCSIDVLDFTAQHKLCAEHRHRHLGTCAVCLKRLQIMAEYYQGDFLAQFNLGSSEPFEEWAMLQRERYHIHAIEALDLLARYHERRDDYERARDLLKRQIALEPWQEEAHRRLIYLLASQGQRSAALQHYQKCSEALARELGVEPTEDTARLCQRIREGQRLRASATLPQDLPAAPTSFVGREQTLDDLAELLSNPDCRLVTLLGPGGIGKTRLALRCAAQQRGLHEHGVAYASMANVNSAAQIPPTLADALNLTLNTREPPQEQLLNYLREKELLLVLDNLEHLLDESAPLLAAILKKARGVLLLTTSRERLNLQEEWIYEVEGLPYPIGQSPAETQETFAALQLFQARAQKVKHRFQVDAETYPFASRICQLVEGMPLGIELAAASVVTRSCQAIAGEIAQTLDGLSSSLRNIPDRHRSVRAAFEHSWQNLSADEKAALGALGVFHGPFSGDAATSIAKITPALLEGLLHKSLVRYSQMQGYTLHALLRRYVQEKSAGDQEQRRQVRAQHAHYYADFMQQHGAKLHSGTQRKTLAVINNALENIRGAWQWALEQQDLNTLNKLADGLGDFYEIRGWYQEGAHAFSEALAALADRENLGKIRVWHGNFAYHTGQYEIAQKSLEKSLRELDASTQTQERAFALRVSAAVRLRHEKDSSAAERDYQESRALYEKDGDLYGVALCLDGLGDLEIKRGEYAAGRSLYARSLEINTALEDPRGIAAAAISLGNIDGRLGDYAGAETRFQEALTVNRQLGNQHGIAACLHNLSTLAYLRQDYATARALRQETLTISRDTGYRWGEASCLKGLGDIAYRTGDYEKATRYFNESLQLIAVMEDHFSLALTLMSLSNTDLKAGREQAAREHLRRALDTAVAIEATPLTLAILECVVAMAIELPDKRPARALAAFVLAHPGSEQQTQDQLQALCATAGITSEGKDMQPAAKEAATWDLTQAVEVAREFL